MSNPIRHIAGPYEDGVQQCVRCLKILIDSRMYFYGGTEGETLPREGFRKGVPISFDNEKWWYEDTYCSRNPIQADNCVPMGEGL